MDLSACSKSYFLYLPTVHLQKKIISFMLLLFLFFVSDLEKIKPLTTDTSGTLSA